jgi:putative DNA primase/helicase
MSAPLPAALQPLRPQRRWVLWKREMVRRGDRAAWTKVPYTAHNRKARSDDPKTWRTHDQLQAGNGFAGVGIMLGDALQGVDLDACIDEDGALEPWAAEVVDHLDSYTEISPSGRGLKVLFYGPPGKTAEVSFGEPVDIGEPAKKRRELAYFTGARYFTVTGRVWRDIPLRTISDTDARWLHGRVEALRTAEKARRDGGKAQASTPPPRSAAGPADDLHPDLLRLIAQGAPEGQRSDQFFHAVRWCADSGLTADAIVALLDFYPGGVGAKYAGRLAGEVARCLEGYVPKTKVKKIKASNVDARPAPTTTEAEFTDPVGTAKAFVQTRHTHGGQRGLHYWQGDFHAWTGTHYEVVPNPDVREWIYEIGTVASRSPVKKAAVDNVIDALRAVANLSHRAVPSTPAWLHRQADDPDPRAVIPMKNGILRIVDEVLMSSTPRLFVPYCLPFEHSVDAPAPVQWFKFLSSVWGTDQESIDCLQEWLGYLLTSDTAMQKALMIVGPKRSGKGTIGRLIVQLLGAGNVASSTLASLGHQFGLQVLIGKTAVLVSDARLGGRADIAAIAENLLRITGEDAITIDRKFMAAYTARLLTRFVLLTNELPGFKDASSALSSRFVILQTTRSFYGKEDHGLDAKLEAELPGILLWALAGLRRLLERGRFVQPKAAAAALRQLEDLASPIGAFLREVCIFEVNAEVPVKTLYEAWCAWCKEHGRDQPGIEQTFGRDLAAAAPQVRGGQRRINGQRVRYYFNVRLRNPDDAAAEAEDDDVF